MHNNKFKVIIVGATILIVAFICISGYKYAQRYKNAQALDIVENFTLNLLLCILTSSNSTILY